MRELRKFVHKDDQGHYRTIGAEEHISLLSLLISFHKEIPASSHHKITSDAISAVMQKTTLTSEHLITEVRKKCEAFLREEKKSYVLVTSTSVVYEAFWWSKFAKMRRMNGSSIMLRRQLPEKFRWEAVSKEVQEFREHVQPEEYSFVTVQLKARTEHEAVDNALSSLDLLRGIWNYSLNVRRREMILGGGNAPKNKIIAGPFSKLYLSTPFSQTSGIWNSNSFRAPAPPPVNLSNAWEGLLEREVRIRKKLTKSYFREKLEEWFRDYGRALDLQDYDLAYLAIWRVIEQMSGVGPNENHAEIAKRVSFLYTDTDYHRLVLNLLKDQRNIAVHTGEAISRSDHLLDELRGYAESLIRFYLDNPFGFKSISDVSMFLRLSPDVKVLENELNIRKFASDFRNGIPRKRRRIK